jgi:glycosyltransferase involved in cell wall biosynthesis
MSLKLPEVVEKGTHQATGPLRVAIVTASLGLAGAEKQAFYMARSLAEAGVNVRVLNLSRGGEYEELLGKMNVPSTCFGWVPGMPFRLMLLIAALWRFRPNIIQSVHAYTNIYSGIAGRVLRAVSIGGLRSDLGAHFDDNGPFSRLLLTLPDAIAVNSQKALDDLRQSRLLDSSRVYFLPNAIDLKPYPEWRQNDTECTCICVSRFHSAKRLDVFIRALAAARREYAGLKGILVGYGPETDRLQKLAAELGLGPDALVFLGFREDIAALLQSASMFVFCSESEGTPNVILEAMAAGLPVVTTPAGDAADVVKPAEAGCVVPFGDVEATAAAIVRLARSPALRRKLGKAGRKYVARNRACSEIAGRLMEIYADVSRTCGRAGSLFERIPR